MSSSIEHLLQEAYILATGKMASPKTLSELKKLEGEGDWAPLVELINTYFDAYEHAVGGRVKLIQLLALNGFGMVLPERDAIQIRNDFGTLGWDSWFSIMANVVLMEGTALDNRAFAIQTVIENLQKTGKAGVLEHAGPQATINAFLKKITDHPDTLKEVAKGLDVFSATLTPRGTITAVVDGYLKNATVFVDANGNNRMDSGEFSIRTNDKGFWVLPHHLEGTRMIALGGQDLMTNKPFKGILSAPLGATVINPFTALVDTFFTRGGGRTSLEKATDAVRSMLGLPETVHLLTYEPLSVLIDRSSSPAEKLAALKVQMQALQIMNLVSSTSKLLFALGHSGKGRANTTDEGMAGEIAAADAVFRAIIDLFLHGEEKVFDLVDTENLRELVTQAAAETNITLAPSAIEKMGAVLSETNARIAEAETIEEVAKVAGVVVSDMVDAVVEAASQGTEGLEAALGQVVTDFTGQQLSEKIDGAQPGVIAPDESGIDPEGNPTEGETGGFSVIHDANTKVLRFSGTTSDPITFTEHDDGTVSFQQAGVEASGRFVRGTEFQRIFVNEGQTLEMTPDQATAFWTIDNTHISISGPGQTLISTNLVTTAHNFYGIQTNELRFKDGNSITVNLADTPEWSAFRISALLSDGLIFEGTGRVSTSWSPYFHPFESGIRYETKIGGFFAGSIRDDEIKAYGSNGSTDIRPLKGLDHILLNDRSGLDSLDYQNNQKTIFFDAGFTPGYWQQISFWSQKEEAWAHSGSFNYLGVEIPYTKSEYLPIGYVLVDAIGSKKSEIMAANPGITEIINGYSDFTIRSSVAIENLNVISHNNVLISVDTDFPSIAKETNGKIDEHHVSDSAPGLEGMPHSINTIQNFHIGLDKLSFSGLTIPSAIREILADGTYTNIANTGKNITIQNGIVVATNEDNPNGLVPLLLHAMGDQRVSAAFSVDNGNYVVIHGDGVAGAQISDLVVQLIQPTGGTLTDLSTIL
jgi:hypothetical protein